MTQPKIIPQPFQAPQTSIASYSAEELASGIGIVNFYAFVGTNPSGAFNGLTEFTLSSYPIETNVTDTTTAFTFTSAEFNLPRYVKGTAEVSVPLYQAAGGVYFQAKIQHWDGTTATDLTGTATSTSPTADPETGTPLVQLPITTEKMVKKGEMIRLIITIVAFGSCYFGHCPSNEASGTYVTQGTRLSVGVPFRRGE